VNTNNSTTSSTPAERQSGLVGLPKNTDGPTYRMTVRFLPETEERLKTLRASHEAQTGERLSLSALVNSAILGRIVKREKPRDSHRWGGR
jgi:hypothetical protein